MKRKPEFWDEMTAEQRGRWEDANGLTEEEQMEFEFELFEETGITEEL